MCQQSKFNLAFNNDFTKIKINMNSSYIFIPTFRNMLYLSLIISLYSFLEKTCKIFTINCKTLHEALLLQNKIVVALGL